MSDLKSLKELVDKLTEKVKLLEANSDSVDFNTLKSEIKNCNSSLNDREQYQRNWCVRIMGLSVPRDLIQKYGVDGACMRHVYDTLVRPTLECSTPDKVAELNLTSATQLESQIDFVPGIFSVLENAHFLGGPTRSKNKNINIHKIYVQTLRVDKDTTKFTKHFVHMFLKPDQRTNKVLLL